MALTARLTHSGIISTTHISDEAGAASSRARRYADFWAEFFAARHAYHMLRRDEFYAARRGRKGAVAISMPILHTS